MKERHSKPRHKGILVHCELVEITDPEQQAALDRRWKAAERAMERAEAKKAKSRKRK